MSCQPPSPPATAPVVCALGFWWAGRCAPRAHGGDARLHPNHPPFIEPPLGAQPQRPLHGGGLTGVCLLALPVMTLAACNGSSSPGLTAAPLKTLGASRGATAGARDWPRLALQQRHALVSFAACMRAHGVHVAPPNTTGRGPVFSTGGSSCAARPSDSPTPAAVAFSPWHPRGRRGDRWDGRHGDTAPPSAPPPVSPRGGCALQRARVASTPHRDLRTRTQSMHRNREPA